jgi:hypothetical protein
MTASQRRASYPPSTEDVKWPHVLVRSKDERRLSETADDEDNIHAAHLPGYKMRLGGPRIDLESLPMDDQGNVRDLQSNIDRITDRGGFSSSPSAQRVLNMGGPIYRYNSLRARLKQRWNGKGSVPKRYE